MRFILLIKLCQYPGYIQSVGMTIRGSTRYTEWDTQLVIFFKKKCRYFIKELEN